MFLFNQLVIWWSVFMEFCDCIFYFPENKNNVIQHEQHLTYNFTNENAFGYFLNAQEYLPDAA